MPKRSTVWNEVFSGLTDDNGLFEFGKVNYYVLTSHLEELYLTTKILEDAVAVLEARIASLEGDIK